MPLKSTVDIPYWFSGHVIEGQGQTANVAFLIMTLCLMVIKLAILVDFREKIVHIAFWGHKVNVKPLVFITALSTQLFMNHLLDNYQTWYSGSQWRVHNSLYIKTLLNFAPGGHRFLLSLTSFSFYLHTPPWKKITFSLFSPHVGWGESPRSRDHPSTVSETEMYPFWFIQL